ncbi:cellulose biosynthesis protein BcsD [Flavisphingomonas formosensis]|uniref:cellulose biosynthesis protein BcsD n=1 Tax=Flavisphingomonas formosensis TaxID=861534 RepID=UPI0012FA19D2|nr:cellulose biosynthesis protein BcsD [Sphingomonas formosensis]
MRSGTDRIEEHERTDSGRSQSRTADRKSLAVLFSLLLQEMRDNASAEEAHGFFQAIGMRLAQSCPLPDVERIDRLAGAMNEVWRALDWGHVILEPDDDGIGIVHFDAPVKMAEDDGGLWPSALTSILEGVYDGWFRGLGSGPKLQTTLKSRTADRIEFHHGR